MSDLYYFGQQNQFNHIEFILSVLRISKKFLHTLSENKIGRQKSRFAHATFFISLSEESMLIR